jgi:uncharacterized protein
MSGMADLLKSRVELLTKDFVDNPEDVKITSSISTKAVILQIKVAQQDCGKIIGKRGRTIDALKVVCMNIKNTKFPGDSRRVLLEVLEDENSSFSYK